MNDHIERKKLYEIKIMLLTGIITYEKAKEMSGPYIDKLNEIGKEIAKKHGRTFVKTTFSSQMR